MGYIIGFVVGIMAPAMTMLSFTAKKIILGILLLLFVIILTVLSYQLVFSVQIIKIKLPDAQIVINIAKGYGAGLIIFIIAGGILLSA